MVAQRHAQYGIAVDKDKMRSIFGEPGGDANQGIVVRDAKVAWILVNVEKPRSKYVNEVTQDTIKYCHSPNPQATKVMKLMYDRGTTFPVKIIPCGTTTTFFWGLGRITQLEVEGDGYPGPRYLIEKDTPYDAHPVFASAAQERGAASTDHHDGGEGSRSLKDDEPLGYVSKRRKVTTTKDARALPPPDVVGSSPVRGDESKRVLVPGGQEARDDEGDETDTTTESSVSSSSSLSTLEGRFARLVEDKGPFGSHLEKRHAAMMTALGMEWDAQGLIVPGVRLGSGEYHTYTPDFVVQVLGPCSSRAQGRATTVVVEIKPRYPYDEESRKCMAVCARLRNTPVVLFYNDVFRNPYEERPLHSEQGEYPQHYAVRGIQFWWDDRAQCVRRQEGVTYTYDPVIGGGFGIRDALDDPRFSNATLDRAFEFAMSVPYVRSDVNG